MTTALTSFFVYAPDKSVEGTFEKRLAVRAKHIESAKSNIGGFLRVAGALLSAESLGKPDSEKRMVGSTFIVEASSIEAVREKLEKDVYSTEGVWDLEKMVILPFVALTQIP